MFGLFGKREKGIEPLFFGTDIHCHIIPGIDDGAKDVDASVRLVENMKEWGLRRVIATPHVTMDSFENTPETMSKALAELRAALDERGIKMEISHSAEYRIDQFFIEQVENGRVVAMPNNYLLIENSFVQEPFNLDQTIFGLNMKGFRPILAHPERYTYYYDKSKRARYDELHGNGTLFQINILSLAGYYGKVTKKIAEEMISAGYVDFLGTDLHHQMHVEAIREYLGSKDYRRHRDMLEGVIRNDTAFI